MRDSAHRFSGRSARCPTERRKLSHPFHFVDRMFEGYGVGLTEAPLGGWQAEAAPPGGFPSPRPARLGEVLPVAAAMRRSRWSSSGWCRRRGC